MTMRKYELPWPVGQMEKGIRNQITDVPGVAVGHCTVDADRNHTGVTVVLPGPECAFTHPQLAASYVLNGFGKTLGLMQVNELGALETPIALTNTLNVGLVHDALVEYTLQSCAKEGVYPRSVNPVVCECNDGRLNEIRRRVVGREEVFAAIAAASPDFEEGDVGAGRGTICYDLKGGIGSASRIMEINGERYTMGILVQSNYGSLQDLQIMGRPIGLRLKADPGQADQGSIIMVAATDLPLCHRQLKRVLTRASVGMARLGSYIGHGSGEVMVGFTTAAARAKGEEAFITRRELREDLLNIPFRAIGECCEEAILKSMYFAHTVTSYTGKKVLSLRDAMKERNVSL